MVLLPAKFQSKSINNFICLLHALAEKMKKKRGHGVNAS